MAEVGRPTEYRNKFAEQAEKLCKLGAIDRELADFFEVSVTTINNWKRQYPEFLASCKKGKEIADDRVEESLFNRAVGYSHDEDHISQYEGKAIITPTVKHYAPDTAACIFWLKNRRPEHWRQNPEGDGPTADLAEAFREIAENLPA